jgi:transketolase
MFMDIKTQKELQRYALQIRMGVAEQIKARGFGHIGGSLSVVDALAVLYGSVMRVDPQNPAWPERDKLVCSKGHAGPAVYATLAAKGFFPTEMLKTLNQPGTNLPSHCDRKKTPGVDMTTGSLGQGTSLAAGLALGDKLAGRDSRVFLIVGDGELNEGQAWEAAMFTAGKKIANLTWIIDVNKKQLDGWTADIIPNFDFEEKFRAFGFDAVTVRGNDIMGLLEVLSAPAGDKPRAVVLDSVKGEGVADVENTAANHSMSPTAEQCDKWLAELRSQLDALN